MTLLVDDIKEIKENPTLISHYVNGVQFLTHSRVLEVLTKLGKPSRKLNSTVEVMAIEGSYAAGWADCLDFLLNFREYFVFEGNEFPKLSPTYGGLRRLIEKGDITEKEADELRKPK